MAVEDFSTLFRGLTLSDIKVDTLGNIRITNKDISRKIAEKKGRVDTDALAESSNYGTCYNTGCLAPATDQLASNPPIRRT